MIGGQVNPVISVIIDNNNNDNNNAVFTPISAFKIFLFIRGRPRQRESVYSYDKESRLKWEFVVEFHLINC